MHCFEPSQPLNNVTVNTLLSLHNFSQSTVHTSIISFSTLSLHIINSLNMQYSSGNDDDDAVNEKSFVGKLQPVSMLFYIIL